MTTRFAMNAAVMLALLTGVAACEVSDADAGAAADRPADAQASTAGVDSVHIREWPVPWARSRPRDPDVAPDGRVWFVGQVGNYIAVLDPDDGSFQRFELADGVQPHNLVVARDGMVWYAGNHVAHIGRLDPRDGSIHVIDMPDADALDPHTLVIAPNGHIWFTVQQGAFAGRLDPATERVDLVRMPRGSRPYGIVTDPDGGAWVALFGTNRIVRLSQSLETRDYDLPAANARARRLQRTSDGAIWYVDHARGALARLDPESGAVREWPTPAGAGSRPYGMAVDDRDHLWFVETGPDPNRLVGFDPAEGRFISTTPIPSGGGSVRHMAFHAPTRSIWFGTDENTIGRATLP